MKDISDAVDLIATARETLLNELLPSLPKDRRYAGLMIANAMAIALREQHSAADAARDEAARIRDLLADFGAEGAPHLPDQFPALRRALCVAIRGGDFDAASRESALMEHLALTAADWVAISNPKALGADRGRA